MSPSVPLAECFNASRQCNWCAVAGAELKYAVIHRNSQVWPVSVQCRILRASVAGYHGHVVRRVTDAHRRHLSDDALLVHIKSHVRRKALRLRLAAHVKGTAGQGHPGDRQVLRDLVGAK